VRATQLHTLTASRLFGVPPDNVTSAMRKVSEEINPEEWVGRHRIWKLCRSQDDFYVHVASVLFGVPEENITPAMRQAAKNQVYWELYLC